MEDKIISVLNNVRTNLSNELETKRKELVKPFDDFADRLSAVEVAPLKIRGLSIEEIDNNFENISVEILEKLEMYKELSKFSFYPLTDEQKLDISNIMKELIKEINEIKKHIVDSSVILKDTDDKLKEIDGIIEKVTNSSLSTPASSITKISSSCSSISLELSVVKDNKLNSWTIVTCSSTDKVESFKILTIFIISFEFKYSK